MNPLQMNASKRCWIAFLAALFGCSDERIDSRGTITVDLSRGAAMEFVWIEPGRFAMGTSEDQEQLLRSKGLWNEVAEFEHPIREVTIDEGFYLGKYEITQAQWESVTGGKPWLERENVQTGPEYPAVFISWNDVRQFILHLNILAGEEMYRLPTEAEWEYACRAGANSLWFFGDDEELLDEHAWYRPNSWDAGLPFAQPAGRKPPNPWGLHDMYGNVWEWCQDWGAFPNPEGGYLPILRGGSFYNEADNVRSAVRIRNNPNFRFSDIGARLVKMR